jgi:hypothetical protein
MSRSRPSVPLAVTPLEDRLTPAYVAADVADFLRAQRIVTSGNITAVGAIFGTWENGGPAADPAQRVADPRESGLAVQGLLRSGNEATPGDNLATAERYLQWYLLNVDASNGFVIQQQWYRTAGGFVRTTAPTSESPYIATFFQTAWDFVRLGGDQAIFNNPNFRSKIISMMNVLLADRQSDNLFVSVAGGTARNLADNSEIYSGLLSASRLMTVVYNDANRAFQYDNAAVLLRDAVRLNFYGGTSVGYGWTKNPGATATFTDDAANPWVTQAVRLYPAIYGIDDSRGLRSTSQLALVNLLWGSGSKDWATRIVDANGNPWTVTGYAQNDISGETTRGNLHNDFIYDFRFANRPTRPVNPVTTGDAGWMLRTAGPFNQMPTAVAQTIALAQGSSVAVTLAGTDPDGNPLRYTVVKPVVRGTFASTGADANTVYTTNNAFTYTPNPGYSGVDTLLFKVSDGSLDSDFVAVTFGVTAGGTGGGDPTLPPVVPGLPPVTLPPPTIPGVPPTVPGVPPTVPGVPPAIPLPPLNSGATLVSSPTSGSAVTVVTDAGLVRSALFPLGATMPGGVRTALADLNADGTPDYLVGSGPGIASVVAGVNGATALNLFRLTPFETGFTGGVFVAAGDLTGDGVPDVGVSADQGGGPRVRIFDGKTQTPVVDFFGIDDRAFRGGARISFGDVNGDGRLDLIVAAGFGGGPRVTVWDGNSLLAGAPRQLANFFAFEASLRNGVYVAAGNFTGGDKLADLVVGAGPGGGPRVSIFSGALLGQGTPQRAADFFSGDPADRGGVSVAAKPGATGDVLVTGSGPSDAISRVRSYAATAIAARPTAPATTFDIEPLDGNASGIYVG